MDELNKSKAALKEKFEAEEMVIKDIELSIDGNNKVKAANEARKDFVGKLALPADLVNVINTNNRNKTLRESNFVSNNDLGKRKFSTLNFNKHNNKLDNLKLQTNYSRGIESLCKFSASLATIHSSSCFSVTTSLCSCSSLYSSFNSSSLGVDLGEVKEDREIITKKTTGVGAEPEEGTFVSASYAVELVQNNTEIITSKGSGKCVANGGKILPNLNSHYLPSSPFYQEIIAILNKGPLNSDTQLKIEKLLVRQGLIDVELKINEGKGYKYRDVNNKILLELQNSRADLENLILNYKNNLNLQEQKSHNLFSLIMRSLDVEFAISIMFGRIFNIIAMSKLDEAKTRMVQISCDLGQEIAKNYLFHCYKIDTGVPGTAETVDRYYTDSDEKRSEFFPPITSDGINTKITLSRWRVINKELVETALDNQLLYSLGNILINWLIELKLIKPYLVVLSKTVKHQNLIPGDRINSYIDQSGSVILGFTSNKIPMIVKPEEYESIKSDVANQSKAKDLDLLSGDRGGSLELSPAGGHDCKQNQEKRSIDYDIFEKEAYIKGYAKIGGYFLNKEDIKHEIILDNWELKTKNEFLVTNEIFDMINFVNSVAYKINEEVLDFFLVNNDKYQFFIDPEFIHPLSLLSSEQKLTKKQHTELLNFNSRKFVEQSRACFRFSLYF